VRSAICLLILSILFIISSAVTFDELLHKCHLLPFYMTVYLCRSLWASILEKKFHWLL